MALHSAHHRRPLAFGLTLAGLVCIAAIGGPNFAAAQTAASDLCDVAKSFDAADRETIRVAMASRDEQLAAQETWHQALAALAEALPAGDVRTAAETLRGAQTVGQP